MKNLSTMRGTIFKIDIITPFYNNESIIDDYQENISILSECKTYDVQFILVCNKSIDNTYTKLIQNKKHNVQIISTHSNGCSLAKNVGLANVRFDSDFVLFLDSDFTINISIIDKLIANISSNVKYVSFYGGNIDNPKYIGGTFIIKDTIINNSNEMKYLGGGCSLIPYDVVKKYGLNFDEQFDPFIMQDVDFSFQVLKYYKIKKIALTQSDNISHICSKTISTFGSSFYKNQLLRNSIIFLNKYNILNNNIFSDLSDFININLFNTMIKYYSDYQLPSPPINKKTLLITKHNYLHFDNVNYYHESIDDLKSFIDITYVSRLILDFSYFTKNYNFIQTLKNTSIEIILDLDHLNINNYKTLNNLSKIHTFFITHQYILKLIFNNKLPVTNLNYKSYQNITNIINYTTLFKGEDCRKSEATPKMKCKILLLINPDQKYAKLYECLKSNNYDYKFVSESDLLNRTDYNIFVDLNINNKLNKILVQKNVWLISPNNYPNRELIKDNINGNIIDSNYSINNNNLLNNISIDIDNYVKFFTQYL